MLGSISSLLSTHLVVELGPVKGVQTIQSEIVVILKSVMVDSIAFDFVGYACFSVCSIIYFFKFESIFTSCGVFLR